MGIRLITTKAETEAFYDKVLAIVARQMRIHLSKLGEDTANKARNKHGNDWTDRTCNLRSSIGYAIYDDGKKIVQSAFESIGNGQQGSSTGKAYVQELASQYSNVYALVVVAGMDYASFVEQGGVKNRKPKDVLAGATLWASKKLDKYMKQALEIATEQINNMII